MTYDTGTGTGTTTQTTSRSTSSAGTVEFPIDDSTYNLLQALTSKLESIDAYRTYMQEDDSSGRIFQQLAQQDANAARQLLDQLRQKLSASGSR